MKLLFTNKPFLRGKDYTTKTPMKLVILTLELQEAKALIKLLTQASVVTELEHAAIMKLKKEIQRTLNVKQRQ